MILILSAPFASHQLGMNGRWSLMKLAMVSVRQRKRRVVGIGNVPDLAFFLCTGANHDCNSGNCQCTGSGCNCCPLSASTCDAGGTFIMNPTSNVSAQEFSPCSVSTICSTLPSIGSCLQGKKGTAQMHWDCVTLTAWSIFLFGYLDPGQRTIESLQMCGNGIVEDGEECDPGSESSSCCDAKTCKFINNAVCE
jgi:hypothetical protein